MSRPFSFSTDPAAYRVEIERSSRGMITAIRVAQPGDPASLADCDDADDGIDRLIRLARDEERCAPGAMPSDRAIVLAAMRDFGITPDEEV